MLDNPDKTTRLLTALKAAAPFEVEVLPSVVKHLQSENLAITNPTRQVVSDLSYAETKAGSCATSSPKENARHSSCL